MKNTHTWLLRVLVAIVVTVVPCTLLAQDSDLMVAAKKLMAAAGGGKTAEAAKAARSLKEAGLSYQKGLVVPLEGVIDCKDRRDQLQVLLGMYLVDDVYAAAFGKQEVCVSTMQVVRGELMERLAARPKLGPVLAAQASAQKFQDADPTDQATWDAFFAEVQANHEGMIKAAEKDPEVMDFLVDRYFGSAVEWMYLGCKLSQGALGGKRLIPIFDTALARIDIVLPVLEALKDPYEQTLFVHSKRIDFLNACKDIIQKKGGELTADDIQAILKLVEPIRSSYTAKCK